MSRLLETIKKQPEKPVLQMGFRKTLPENKRPSILLIARTAVDEAGTPVKNIAGADAVLLDFSSFKLTPKNLPKIVKPLGETPWGLYTEYSKDTAAVTDNSGCDFIVFSPASPVAAAPGNDKTGKIIQVESTLDDGLLLALNDLPVDAVLAADSFGESDPLTYHHLMLLKYLAVLVKKPLIVPVPATISKEELQALRDAGIAAVLVTIDISKAENLKELHEIAAGLPPRATGKQDKPGVFLPRSGGAQMEPLPDEEEEEDE